MLDPLTGALILVTLVTAVFCVYKVVRITTASKLADLVQKMQGPDAVSPNPVRVSLPTDDAEKQFTLALSKIEKWHGWLIKSSQNNVLTAEANWTTTLEQALGNGESTSTPMKTKIKLTANIRKVGMGRETEVTWRYEPECWGWHDPTLRCENPETDTMCEITNLAIWDKLGAFEGKATPVQR
jgi:hypothetical protein